MNEKREEDLEDIICEYADLTEPNEIGLDYANCNLLDIKCFHYTDNKWCGAYYRRNKDE